MMKLLEQLSLNIPDYSAVIFAWSGISSVILIYLMGINGGDLLQKPLIPVAHSLCHYPSETEKSKTCLLFFGVFLMSNFQQQTACLCFLGAAL